MTDLPPPDVNVTSVETDTSEVNIIVSRKDDSGEDRGRKYTGVSTSTNGAIKDAVEKLLNDPYTAEWLPSKKPNG